METIQIIRVETPEQYELGRKLFREYAEWLSVDISYQGFEQELQTLPKLYGPPRGAILLAMSAGEAVGCVAVRELVNAGGDACEMKRLYVQPRRRGQGLGRRLVEELLDTARGLGYRRMLLDTLSSLHAALQLYRELGFQDVAPYCHNPYDSVIFLERDLSG